MTTSAKCGMGGKHEVAYSDNIIERLGGRIYCAKCGMYGHVSQGRRKSGRAPRIFWHPSEPPRQVAIENHP